MEVIDMTGKKVGRLTVIERVYDSNDRNAKWLCQCECGNYTVVHGTSLRSKYPTRSCGCLVREVSSENAKRRYTHNASKTRLYQVWSDMKQRCNNKNVSEFKNYGQRGITVCDEWHDFVPFKEWAEANGYDENAPHHQCTLDRIDVNGNYEPSNCRWISQKEQCNNTRRNVFVEVNGENLTISQWSEKLNIPVNTLRKRYSKGWRGEKFISPPDKRYSHARHTTTPSEVAMRG